MNDDKDLYSPIEKPKGLNTFPALALALGATMVLSLMIAALDIKGGIVSLLPFLAGYAIFRMIKKS